MPATIRATLSSANPAAAAESPVNAFSSEITTGMSAPPIGSTNRMPEHRRGDQDRDEQALRRARVVVGREHDAAGEDPDQQEPLMMCWPGNRIGRPEISSWSLPKAMFEPQKETEPTTIENRIGINTSSGMSPPSASWWRNSDQAISAAAPPPTPL